MRIDGEAVVPIGWVLSGFGLMTSITIIGAMWVGSVNYRLQRIEEKLGIPAYKARNDVLLESSFASETHQTGKR